MKTKSLWGQPPKRLYKFIDLVNQRADNMRHICVVGASDGKFVLPMLRKGLSVTAIEIDNIAIHGGEKIVPLPRKNVVKINYKECQGVPEYPEIPYQKIMATGLLERVQKEKLEAKFELLEMDFYHNVSQNQYDAVFTSCSMQYKGNRDLSLQKALQRLQDAVKPGGLLYMDYMMPPEDSHDWKSELFLRTGHIKAFFQNGWKIIHLRELKKPVFEAAHVDRPSDHFHRFGYILAEKLG